MRRACTKYNQLVRYCGGGLGGNRHISCQYILCAGRKVGSIAPFPRKISGDVFVNLPAEGLVPDISIELCRLKAQLAVTGNNRQKQLFAERRMRIAGCLVGIAGCLVGIEKQFVGFYARFAGNAELSFFFSRRWK